ncbi:zinc finger BED domain-containing protein RICESLEEPER 3-like [Coffea arabica]|uniref:Zinc finger BED domain-containing protein RICESLEEPER 3-like n=1 Tax=Coffea arabica TaxID=13443 RepID=A0ABM4UKN1_COFAR
MGIAIVKHNHPYRLVEQEGIQDLCVYLNSDALPISRNTTNADIEKMYKKEKEKLKIELNSISSRICLTADLWTSIAIDGYLALTTHFVDEDWILQKRVLNFHHMPPPHGDPILAEKVIDLLRDWAVEKKVFTITLDNASYNDVITEEVNNLDIEVSEMAKQMKLKFEKYWKCYSLVLNFTIILDPRFKMDYVVYAFKKLYPFDYEERAKEVRDKFYLLFEKYENTFDGDLLDGSITGCSGGDLGNDNDDFAEFESQQHANKRNKSQIDSYLDDTRLFSTQELDVLNFWPCNLSLLY